MVAMQTTDELNSRSLRLMALAVGVLPDVQNTVCMVAMQTTDELSSRSLRLMALAVGVLPDVHNLDVQRMSQQQLEEKAVHLELLGLLMLTNRLRPDSKRTVAELQDKYDLCHPCSSCCKAGFTLSCDGTQSPKA